MASACPRGETRSSATGIETVSGSPAAVLASQDVAWTHPLPASGASRADRRRRPRPRTAARGGRRWSRVCTSAPASDAAGVTARAAVARRAPAREALALLPARGRAWASVSQTPETFWPQTQPLPLPAPCLRPWTVTFWSRKRCDTVSVYGIHLFLDLILPWSKLQKRMAAQECCTPFSQALVSSPGGVSGTTVIGCRCAPHVPLGGDGAGAGARHVCLGRSAVPARPAVPSDWPTCGTRSTCSSVSVKVH